MPGAPRDAARTSFGPTGGAWTGLAHLLSMDIQRSTALGLDPLLTTAELADYLGVAVQAIYDLRSAGRGPIGVRVGRELRYRVGDVKGWLDSLPDGVLGAEARLMRDEWPSEDGHWHLRHHCPHRIAASRTRAETRYRPGWVPVSE